uniref:Large proline-rich protein BAG6-like n=1 Tax=Phascolarctos cinereus TaxID=38626 RepID=A0A6P5IYU1_PHACI|nr:large proline-rich protein BAG6-like [Phascolarctos cinereus]
MGIGTQSSLVGRESPWNTLMLRGCYLSRKQANDQIERGSPAGKKATKLGQPSAGRANRARSLCYQPLRTDGALPGSLMCTLAAGSTKPREKANERAHGWAGRPRRQPRPRQHQRQPGHKDRGPAAPAAYDSHIPATAGTPSKEPAARLGRHLTGGRKQLCPRSPTPSSPALPPPRQPVLAPQPCPLGSRSPCAAAVECVAAPRSPAIPRAPCLWCRGRVRAVAADWVAQLSPASVSPPPPLSKPPPHPSTHTRRRVGPGSSAPGLSGHVSRL